jgi:hypothetical protein
MTTVGVTTGGVTSGEAFPELLAGAVEGLFTGGAGFRLAFGSGGFAGGPKAGAADLGTDARARSWTFELPANR